MSDPSHTAMDAFGVFDTESEIAWHAVYLAERDGTIAWRYLGDTYEVRPTTAELLRALDGG